MLNLLSSHDLPFYFGTLTQLSLPPRYYRPLSLDFLHSLVSVIPRVSSQKVHLPWSYSLQGSVLLRTTQTQRRVSGKRTCLVSLVPLLLIFTLLSVSPLVPEDSLPSFRSKIRVTRYPTETSRTRLLVVLDYVLTVHNETDETSPRPYLCPSDNHQDHSYLSLALTPLRSSLPLMSPPTIQNSVS